MTTAANLREKRKLLSAAIVTVAFLFVAQTPVAAQTEGCAVGARVQIDTIGNSIGTITEIGNKPPHDGWYRVVFDWNVRAGNEQGEWYNPKTKVIQVVGTSTKCGRSAEDDSCPMSEPPGKVTKTSPASAQLFKRVIYETMAAKVNEKSISAPKQIGLTFFEFEMGRAYKNTLTANRIGDRRLHDGAPVGAMIYPVKTKYLRCELYDREISAYVRQTNYACFKNRFGDWDCPVDSTTKTLERRTIPIK